MAAGQATSPVQWPLLNPPRPPVKPNLMITLDDSGSMGMLYMPDSSIKIGRWSFESPAEADNIGFDPGDTAGNVRTDQGTFTAERDSDDWTQRVMRSPDTNPIYYNPEVRYSPWLRADGTRYPAANIRAAVLDPTRSDSATVDLSVDVPSKRARWCRSKGCRTERRNYAPGLYYRLRRDASGDYLDPEQSDSYAQFDVNHAAGRARSPGRSDCDAVVCTLEQERQNFANWFVYYRSRLHVSKAILGETLGRMQNQARVGYGRINKRTGPLDGLGDFAVIESGVRDFDAARKAQVLEWVYRMQANGTTPLGLAIQEVGRYYETSDSRGPWGATPGVASDATQASCRAAFHLLITDGYWSGGPGQGGQKTFGNVDGKGGVEIPLARGGSWTYQPSNPYKDRNGDTLADIAMYYWYRDLRPDLPNHVPPRPGSEASWQSMSNFIVGLGVNGLLDPSRDLPALRQGTRTWSANKIDDLWHAALNSRGAYFSATDPEALRSALREVMTAVAPAVRRQAGVAVTSQDAQAGARKYVPVYNPDDWSGDLQAFDVTDAATPGAARWSAREALPAWSARQIFIWDDGQAVAGAVPFRWDSMSAKLKSALGGGARQDIVNYLRGDRSLEAGSAVRVRSSVLGDFINSAPVVGGQRVDPELARLPEVGATYEEYLHRVKRLQPRVVYAGSNDGMLHAFRDAQGADGTPAGREIFAYIPRAVAAQLVRLSDPGYGAAEPHRYFVDGPLRESDVHVPPPDGGRATWRNYLFGSTGGGPAAVFALDITEPAGLNARSPRWEVSALSEPKLGHVMTPVVTGMLPNGKWVALFGNGYGSVSGQAHLFVVEIASGAVHTIDLPLDRGKTTGLGGVALRQDSLGQVIGAYAGDLSGRLWRLDFSALAPGHFVVGLGGQPLFKAPSGQSFVQAPLVRQRSTGMLVLAGTGRLLTQADASDLSEQALYAVEDREGESLPRPLQPVHLQPWGMAAASEVGGRGDPLFFALQPAGAADAVQSRGWRLPLSGQGVPVGLRLLQPLQGLGDSVLVGLDAPPKELDASADPCLDARGLGLNLLLQMSAAPIVHNKPVLDTDADGAIGAGDAVGVAGYRTEADGVDAVIAMRGPVGPSSVPASSSVPAPGPAETCANKVRIHGTSGSMVGCNDRTRGNLRDRVWRRILTPPF